MTLTIGNLIAIASVQLTGLGLIMTVLMLYVKKSNKTNEEKIEEHVEISKQEEKRLTTVLDKLNTNLEHLNNEVHQLQVEITEKYVRIETLNDQKKDNKLSHENFWNEFKDLRERMVEVEVKQSGGRNRKPRKK
jgi:septal ring factor EnvC (AmiA/AmiB activator)